MADQTGPDVILQVLDEVRGLGGRMDRLDSRMDRMEARMADISDTLMLVAATVQRLTSTVKGRIDDHEARIQVLEKARAG